MPETVDAPADNEAAPAVDAPASGGGSDASAAPAQQIAFSANGMRLGIFVISYNAEKFISDTLRRIPEEVWREVEVVYVVDDCSMDGTTAAAISHAEHKEKIVVFRNRVNRRYGGNQKFGYQYAIDRGLDAVVMLHGDGQYAPEMLPEMFRPLVEQDADGNSADVVIGSRMINRADALKGGMPKYKFVANIFLTKVENALAGLSMSEFHSGYRGYATKFLKRVPLWKDSDEWHFDSHILFQARQARAKIVEFAIPTKYGDEVCHVNGIAYGLNCIASAIVFRLHRWGLIHVGRYDLVPESARDSRKFDDPFSSHSMAFNRLDKMKLVGARVLDCGFGCAAIASKLQPAGAVIDGVDIDPAAIEENRHIFAKVFEKDLNRIDEIGLSDKYDIVLLADILQYLVSPADFLSRLKKYLVKGGSLIVIVPNFVNITTRWLVFWGRFPLHHRGIIDEKALHFYTLRQLKILLRRTGWELTEEAVSSMPLMMLLPFLKLRFFRPLAYVCRAFTKLFKGLFGYQFICVCKNPNDAELL